MSEPGLDHAFLRFIGATPESQKHWQRFYVPMYAGCRDVLDLGCGSGDFLEMLAEQGVRVHGVDLDPGCCADARSRGLEVECADVLEYLRDAPPEQFDGVFCAHLVEHLPYEAVLQVVRGCLRVLRPEGRVVLVTPNASSLFAHLEMYYRHFGHVSFYHPVLLRFFLNHVGFTDIATGTNPTMGTGATWDMRLGEDVRGAFRYDHQGSPVERIYSQPVPVGQPQLVPSGPDRHLVEASPPGPTPAPEPTSPLIAVNRRLPVFAPGLLGRLVGLVKQSLATWLVLPYVDELVASTNARAARQEQALAQLQRTLAQLQQHTLAQLQSLAATLGETSASLNVTIDAVNAGKADLAVGLHHVNVSLAETNKALDGLYHQLGLVDARLRATGDAAELAAERLVGALERVDPPWECYATAVKAGDEHDQTA